MKLKKYTLEQLKQAVLTSNSKRMILEQLNVSTYGGNYIVLERALAYFQLDTSHFSGQGWRKGKILPRIPTADYLNNKYPVGTHKLRLKLIQEGFLEHKCSNCNLIHWLNNPIPLELHHKDGDNTNNILDNLELLCPNCHSLTHNFRGKNKIPKLGSGLPST